MAMRRLMTSMRDGLMGSRSSISMLRGAAIVRWCLRCLRLLLLLLRWLSMKVWNTIWIGWCALRLIVVALEVVRMAIVPSSRLGNVRNDLHASGNDTGWPTTTSSISRCCRSSKALCQLFNECLPYIIRSDVNSICNPENY